LEFEASPGPAAGAEDSYIRGDNAFLDAGSEWRACVLDTALFLSFNSVSVAAPTLMIGHAANSWLGAPEVFSLS